ncbi:MAG TPA: hypothetical protein VF182_19115, partial [Candidatus Binatia bacterium]
ALNACCAKGALREVCVVLCADAKEGQRNGVGVMVVYRGRKFGLRSALALSRAWQLRKRCPARRAFLFSRMPMYRNVSPGIMGSWDERSGPVK